MVSPSRVFAPLLPTLEAEADLPEVQFPRLGASLASLPNRTTDCAYENI